MTMPVDSKGSPLREGAPVRLLRTDPGLLNGLPDEDQQAIKWASKEAELKLVGWSPSGSLELEFTDPGGTMHWIVVNPNDVLAVTGH